MLSFSMVAVRALLFPHRGDRFQTTLKGELTKNIGHDILRGHGKADKEHDYEQRSRDFRNR